MTVHSVRMPRGIGKHANKSNGRPLFAMAHLKINIVEVKAEEYCLAHEIIIAIAKGKMMQNINRVVKVEKYVL